MKLYVDEPGHEDVSTFSALYGSVLARVEVPAALHRKHHLGEITRTEAADLVRAFEDDALALLLPTGHRPRSDEP